MSIAKPFAPASCFLGTIAVLIACFAAAPTRAEGQCTNGQGLNAVYGNCSGSVGKQGTYAFIDASQYQSQGDICQAMKTILNTFNTNNANGVVVDARGFPLPQGQNAYPCSVNPWSNSLQPSNNVVLLPSGTITLQTTWTLPTNTRIIGQGPNVTILQAASGFAGSDVVDMGTTNGSTGFCDGQSPPYCAGIGIEHLALVGYGTNTTNGIVNCCSQELSYVNDVILTNLGGTGLLLQGNAGNSGPYSKISFSGSGICTQVLGPTRGIHGLSCVTTGSSAGVVYVDANNNSIEDLYIQGGSLQDGVLIGSQAAAQGNLLFNISGSGLANVVHLTANASEVTILGTTRSGGTSTIKDDLVSKSITDANVAMYAIGEAVQGNNGGTIGNSRFTTSTSSNALTWLFGPNSPTGSNCSVGSLFSCTGTTTSCKQGANVVTLSGCGTTGWYPIK